MLKIVRFWLPVATCMGFIFYASSIPGSDIPPLFPGQDIVFHFVIYMALAYFFSRALKNTADISAKKVFIFTLIFGVLYAISDEIHQAFVPLRSVSGFDVFIDGCGTFAGSLIRRWLT
jgi:VanZ family protein